MSKFVFWSLHINALFCILFKCLSQIFIQFLCFPTQGSRTQCGQKHYLNTILYILLCTVSAFMNHVTSESIWTSRQCSSWHIILTVLMHIHKNILKFPTRIHVLNLIDIYRVDGSIFYNGSTIRRWRKVGDPK